MPFDDKLYDGIFCYGLIYLLDENERAKLIQDCFNQLTDDGYMVFTAISKDAQTYGQGTQISKDRFEMFGGVTIFFYDKQSIEEEFGNVGLFEITEVTENYPFYSISCGKHKRNLRIRRRTTTRYHQSFLGVHCTNYKSAGGGELFLLYLHREAHQMEQANFGL